jgi:hypothetical protein
MASYLYAVVPWPLAPEPSAKSTAKAPRASKRAKATSGRGGRAAKTAPAAPADVAPPVAPFVATDGPDLGAGVGDPPRAVETLVFGDLAAVVSGVAPGEVGGENVRALRRDMKAHSAILNRLVELGAASVLPVRFGAVFPTAQLLVDRLLKPQYPLLKAHLGRLAGATEVSLKVTYAEDEVLREVVEEHPELARRSGGGGSYQAKIDLGQRIAREIQARQERDAQWVLDALKPVARDVRTGKPGSDMTVLSASFLVEKQGMDRFDRVLERLNAEAGRVMRFDCVGPLPPYSFADLRL